jgi:anthranilate/para-aminobenzoate synthase component I
MPDGLRCSIPIRTGELDADGLTVQSGGGIVIDSDPEAERLETWAKVRAFDRGDRSRGSSEQHVEA